MKKAHGNSRRQAYGRRMKDLRTRRSAPLEIDLDGPDDWRRGGAWDDDQSLHPTAPNADDPAPGARSR